MTLPGLKYYFESGKLISPVPVPNHRVIHGLCLQSLLAAPFESSIYLGEDLVFSLGLWKRIPNKWQGDRGLEASACLSLLIRLQSLLQAHQPVSAAKPYSSGCLP